MPDYPDTELILTPEKKVYHLDLDGEDIADHVILVGDQNRVAEVSKYFDRIELRASHREFITHTGTLKGRRISVISTGIGTDNIDIVLNELDAAVNIDLQKRTLRKERRSLRIFRLGTCGSLQPDIPVDALVAGTHGIGLDGLLNFYKDMESVNEKKIADAFIAATAWSAALPYPYVVAAAPELLQLVKDDVVSGLTATAPGFYAPQGRAIRLQAADPGLNEKLMAFNFEGLRVVNFEMETSALYGLGKLLGHRCLTLCVVIANRAKKEFSPDYKKSIGHLIEYSLNKITNLQ